MTELRSSYPYGEQQCATVTPDHERAFVAEGASIAILDTSTPSAPAWLQSVPIPEAAPKSLLYYRHPDVDPGLDVRRRWLFVAGGTMGLWRIDLCEDLFDSPEETCLAASFAPIQLDIVGSPGTYQFKRAVDLAIVEDNPVADAPLLFVLYASRSDMEDLDVVPAGFGGTEVRAYRLDADGSVTLFTSYDTSSANFTQQLPTGAPPFAGTALASDPEDPWNLYVAMGTAWLWKISIGDTIPQEWPPTGTVLLTRVEMPSTFEPCDGDDEHCPVGEQMRDIALVRTETEGPVVYGVFEFGRVAEFQLDNELVGWTTVNCVTDEGTGLAGLERVAVAPGDGNTVFIAVGLAGGAGLGRDSAAPSRPDGVWGDICIAPAITGIVTPPNLKLCQQIRFLWSNLDEDILAEELDPTPVEKLTAWGSLLVERTGTIDYLVWSSTSSGGFSVHELEGAAPPPNEFKPTFGDADELATYVATEANNPIVSPSSGAISMNGWNLSYLGGESFGEYGTVGQVLILDDPEPAIVPVLKTASACPGSPGDLPTGCPSTKKAGRPNPFGSGIVGVAQWLHPFDSDYEWFMPGDKTSWVPTDCNCNPVAPCSVGSCSTVACGGGTQQVGWRQDTLDGASDRASWRLVRLKTGNLTTASDGEDLEMLWWQLPSVTEHTDRSETVPYAGSTVDLRFEDGQWASVPQVVYCQRSGSDWGLKAFRPRDLMIRADGRCPGGSNGNGQNLLIYKADEEAEEIIDIPDYREVLTHIEFEIPRSQQDPGEYGEPCHPLITSPTCGGFPTDPTAETQARYLGNNHSAAFKITRFVGSTPEDAYILALATAFVAAAPDDQGTFQQTADCRWTDYFGQPLLTLFDVTATPGDGESELGNAPKLLRVGVGEAIDPHPGNAWAVQVKTYDDGAPSVNYAFVGELTGRLLVYDVSPDQIPDDGEDGEPYLGVDAQHSRPLLHPVAVLEFPVDPYDGYRPNCVDLALDPELDVIYCAIARGGVAVVDISCPESPELLTILDTPGMAQGVTLRKRVDGENNYYQIVVGDSRAGPRVYARPGQM